MRSLVRSIVVVALLGSASVAYAQDAEKQAVPKEPADEKAAPQKKERQPFIKRDGQTADNEQLGGEPSLTEVETPSATEQDVEDPELQGCDLDCIEAEFEKDDAKAKQKKRTLEVARESGSATAEVTDAGDSLSAEPSTTTIDEADLEIAKDKQLPTRLGPVRIPVGKGDDWIGIGLAVQMEFEYDQQFAGGGFEKESTQTLEFRRVRFTLSSSFIEGRIKSRFQINLTPSAFELIDLWFAFTRFKFATFRLGQFKIPYDRYRAQSFASLSFVDWAPTTRMFGSERQVGGEMLASGGILDLEYSIGVFSGVNARAAHGVGITEVYGEVPTSASDLGFGEVVSAFHPEIAGRAARNFGEIDTANNSDVLQTDYLRHSIGVGFAWDARPEPVEDLALRLSLEWLGKIRGVYIDVINYIAWYKPWEGGKILFGPLGVMAESGYRFTLIWELAIRFSLTYLTPWLRSDARSYGEVQIMDATDPAAAMLQYGRNGDQTTNQTLSLAGVARVIGNSLKIIGEVGWARQRWNTGSRNGLLINAQLQLVF